MKFLFVIDSLVSGGAQRLYINLAKVFVQRGHAVEVFIYSPENQFYDDEFVFSNIKVHVADRPKSGFSWYVVKQLRQVVRVGVYDGVLSILHAPSIYAALGTLGLKSGKLAVWEVSSSIAPVKKMKRFLFYLATLAADSVVTNTHNEANIMRRQLGLGNKTTAVWNGYDLDVFEQRERLDNREIEQLLIVGRIAYPKNGVNLLKGLGLFLSRNNWLPKVVWAGRNETDQKSRLMQQEMDQYLAENPGVAEKFLRVGEVKNINELYSKSDALILVSIYEGLPNVICEAMLIGCPVIASNVCEHPEVLGKNEERGLLCDPYSPASICDAIERFSKMSVVERGELAKKSRHFAETNFEVGHMAEKFEHLFGS